MTSIFIDFLINILSKDQPHAASTFVLKIGHVTGHMFTPRILIGELVPIECAVFYFYVASTMRRKCKGLINLDKHCCAV